MKTLNLEAINELDQKEKMIIFDPGNETISFKNCNRGGVINISDEIYYYYFQFPGKCEDCPLDRQENIPECLSICRFRLHPDGDYYYVETKTDNKIIDLNKNISMSRGNLVFNHELKLKFGFRSCNHFYINLHHINGNNFDDNFINLTPRDDHKELEGRITWIENRIILMEDIYQNNKDKKIYKMLYDLRKRLEVEIKNSKKYSPIFHYIVKTKNKELEDKGLLVDV